MTKTAILRFAPIAAIISLNSITGCNNDEKKPTHEGMANTRRTVLGFGFSGVDYIATVGKYPSPDEKVRTLSLSLTGGGNCGNTMSTIGILGSSLFKNNDINIRSKIITKIADDSNGRFVEKGLQDNCIDTNDIIISPPPSETGFVYVIVDAETKTRTCLATLPNAEISDDEISNKLKDNVLKDVSLIHFDSRHTQAATKLASIASTLSIPMSIDLEKDRPPFLRKLLPYCNIVFTNENAVQKLFDNVTNDNRSGTIKIINDNIDDDAIMEQEELVRRVSLMAYSFSTKNIIDSKVHTVISTLGSNGSILIRKKNIVSSNSILSDDKEIGDKDIDDLKKQLANCNISIKHYEYYPDNSSDVYEILTCSCVKLSPDEIIDTTGAGDSYIGGFIVGMVSGLSLDECMKVGTLIAANVIMKEGARLGIMSGKQLRLYLAHLSSNAITK